MRKDDLTEIIAQLGQSGPALNRLFQLPKESVDAMIELLNDPRSVEQLKCLFEAIRSLHTEAHAPRNVRRPLAQTELRGLNSALSELFSDKERFPTVASIAGFTHDVFGVDINPRKDSRERYVRSVVRAVSNDPKALFHVRNAISKGQLDERDRAYKSLYRFIRGRLSD